MKAIDFFEANKDRFLEELMEILRIPSVSANSNHKNDMWVCVENLKVKLQDAGADFVEICPTN